MERSIGNLYEDVGSGKKKITALVRDYEQRVGLL